jgi:hypothetical protein
VLIGGTGRNVFNENATGSGEIIEVDSSNTLNVPQRFSDSYQIF